MKFSNAEIRFLSEPHEDVKLPAFPVIDSDTLGTGARRETSLRCIESILEKRAAKIGPAFDEFRKQQRPASVDHDLAFTRLF